MTLTQWFIFFLIIQVIHFLGTWKLYIKAGRKAWEAAIPIYNGIVFMKILNRPWWWIFLLFIPIINLIMFPVVWVETARSFGKNQWKDSLLAVVSLGFYAFYLNYTVDVEHVKDREREPISSSGQWVSSILFAVVAATFVHTYFMQPYIIPSASLEKSLLVGDFLLVSKFHYGARVPMTTVAAPMVHDTIPVIKKKSYLFNDQFEKRYTSWKNKLQLPYMRLPGFDKIERNEIVVFNQPADTLLDMNDFNPDRNYYKPIDKKTNLVKRCVGLPGDTLSIVDGYVHINGKQNVLSDRAHLKFIHAVSTNAPVAPRTLAARLGLKNYYGPVITIPQEVLKKDSAKVAVLIEARTFLHKIKEDSVQAYYMGGIREQQVANYLQAKQADNMMLFNLADDETEAYEGKWGITTIEKINLDGRGGDTFPHDPNYNWTVDNFGPLYIPKAGEPIHLTPENLPVYQRLITEYEGNTLSAQGTQILINGKVTNQYTPKWDYYWMMGDNRQSSIDARAWGFVPYTHIVGKPVFIWMSIDGFTDGIGNWQLRTDRIFTTVHGEGDRVSYFPHFLIGLALWFAGSYFWKRRRSKSAA